MDEKTFWQLSRLGSLSSQIVLFTIWSFSSVTWALATGAPPTVTVPWSTALGCLNSSVRAFVTSATVLPTTNQRRSVLLPLPAMIVPPFLDAAVGGANSTLNRLTLVVHANTPDDENVPVFSALRVPAVFGGKMTP